MTLAKARSRLNVRRTYPILLTDAARCPDPLPWIRRRKTQPTIILLRHYQIPWRWDLLAQIRAMGGRRHTLIVALEQRQDWHKAATMGADGVHLNRWIQQGGCLAAVRLWATKRRRLITASAHDHRELVRATRLGAQAVLISPVFATRSHPNARPLGNMGFAALARHSTKPAYALGGITPRTQAHLRHHAGWATIGA